MSKAVILVIAGVALGAALGFLNVGGEACYRALNMAFDGAASISRLV